jgi:hypothetical protein
MHDDWRMGPMLAVLFVKSSFIVVGAIQRMP